MSIPVLAPQPQLWVCPNCDDQVVFAPTPGKPIMHPCRGMAGLSVPMVPEGVRCKIESHEREDYINGDLVQTDGEGRPIMNVTTVRDDGQDCTVYAPTATGKAEDFQ